MHDLANRVEARQTLPYMPGLDGVRALAVAAVVLYHLEVGWLPGGFLGVDMFFVVSGFLITSLLLADVRRRGRFDVRDFWWRRARRLLPALTVVILAVVLYVAFVHPSELAGLRGQVVAAGGYVTNWALIVTDTSYFEAFSRPPLLRHLWSLAVEEQFYLLWPVAFAAGWALLRRRMLSVVWLGAAASALAMALLYEPLTDPSRVYFGTDTRAVGLLVGVGLAYITTPSALTAIGSTAGRLRQELCGWAGLAVVTAMMIFGSEFAPAMYRGGFLLAAVATMALIVGAAGPTRLARFMSIPALVWLGRRSYGIYLWHWPVLMLTRPELDVAFGGARLLAFRVGLILALAAASYRWIERPIIERGFGGWIRGEAPRGLLSPRRLVPPRAAAVGGAFALVVVTLAAMAAAPPSPAAVFASPDAEVAIALPDADAPAATPPPTANPSATSPPATGPPGSMVTATIAPDRIATGWVPQPTTPAPPTINPTAPPAGGSETPTDATTTSRDPGGDSPTVSEGPEDRPTVALPPGTTLPPETTTTTETPPTTVAEPEPPPRITAVGDSVMLGAAEALGDALGPRATVDGLVSRSFANGVSLLAGLADEKRLGNVVVVHLGTNGPIDDALVDDLMAATRPADRVLALTVRVPRRWEDQVNETLRAGAKRFPKLELIDWHGAADDRPKLFVDDGVHLTGPGRTFYADLVAAAIGG